MVTAITVNPSTVKPFRDMILTSSVDWTVKLWNIQRMNTSPSPILEFSASAFDYYCSVRWCPIHPGIFSTITSGSSFSVLILRISLGGVLMLWNICQSLVEPVGTLKIQTDESKDSKDPTKALSSTSALNKTVWIADGKKLLVGDSK
jgi:hypothetical protein